MSNKRIPVTDEQLAYCREQYQEGASILDLSFDYYVSTDTIRRWLVEAGTTIRARGDRAGRKAANQANAKPPKRTYLEPTAAFVDRRLIRGVR